MDEGKVGIDIVSHVPAGFISMTVMGIIDSSGCKSESQSHGHKGPILDAKLSFPWPPSARHTRISRWRYGFLAGSNSIFRRVCTFGTHPGVFTSSERSTTIAEQSMKCDRIHKYHSFLRRSSLLVRSIDFDENWRSFLSMRHQLLSPVLALLCERESTRCAGVLK